MKNTFLLACATALLSACSGPSYYLMSAKTGTYHNNNYQVPAAEPVAASQETNPENFLPVEASTEKTPAIIPDQSVSSKSNTREVERVPVTNARTTVVTKKEIAKAKRAQAAKHFKSGVKKYNPVNVFKQFASNTNIALIFIISGLLVMLLLPSVLSKALLIGVLLIIAGLVFLLI